MLALCALTLAAALVLGGGTRPGLPSDAVLQLLSIPLLLAAIAAHVGALRRHKSDGTNSNGTSSTETRNGWVMALVAVAVAVPLLQLVPLPTGVWQSLPLRQLVTQAFDITGTPPVEIPLSLTPRETSLAALSLVTPVGIFLGVSLLNAAERRSLVIVLMTIGMIGVILGLLQVAQGRQSDLRFYEITNPDNSVGFFANRNHFATLINVLTVFVGCWVVAMSASDDRRARLRLQKDSVWIFYWIGGLVALVILLAAQATAYSRAGFGLMFAALLAVLLLAQTRTTAATSATSTSAVRPIVLVLLGAVILALPFALDGIVARFVTDPLDDLRVRYAKHTIEAAKTFMPWGSGIGSFVPTYQIFESTNSLTPDVYANRAHNDFLEVWLETGVAGILLAIVFMGWVVASAYSSWAKPDPAAQPLDRMLMGAATASIMLLLLHSVVDYPLRTGALMAVAGLCCGLLVRPGRSDDLDQAKLNANAAMRSSRPVEPIKIQAASTAPQTPSTLAWTEQVTASPIARPPPSPADAPAAAWNALDGGVDVAPRPSPAGTPPSASTEWPDAWSKQPAGPSPPPSKKPPTE